MAARTYFCRFDLGDPAAAGEVELESEVVVVRGLDHPDGPLVRIGDRELALDITAFADGGLLVRRAGEGAGLRLAAVERPGGLELVTGGRGYRVDVESERDRWLREATGGAADAGGKVSVSMPGQVVKVLVSEGDVVQAGQPLLIVEAMKMENEVKAAADGTVVAICVAEGQAVEAGQTLVELEV